MRFVIPLALSVAGTGVTTLACLHRWRLADFARIPATRDPVVFERVSG
jgi:hypothetical protein